MATAHELVGERYLALIREFPLRRLRDEADLDRAIAMLDKLVDLGMTDRSQEETDYLDVLSTLVEQHEEIHYPMREATTPPEGEVCAKPA